MTSSSMPEGESVVDGVARSGPTGGAPVGDARSLAQHTTLRLGGPAAELVTARSADELVERVRVADGSGARLLVLGGGSNLVVPDEGFAGRVVRVATTGLYYERLSADTVCLTAEAGENWDEVVADSVRRGLGGLECLSGIPGLTGATPVQNVGAYGVEISERLISVDLLDRFTGEVRTAPAGELGLAYRTSVLKHADSAVVLRVRLRLRADGLSEPVRYGELAESLGADAGERVAAERVRDAVLALRRSKGMVLDEFDHDTWSAGSFFTNPIVGAERLPEVLRVIGERVGEQRIPRYSTSAGDTKLSAAWLIERAGFAKGYAGPGNRVGLSTKHTLALTNRGSASTSDLLALAGEVRAGVRESFGVSLAPEPVLVDCLLR